MFSRIRQRRPPGLFRTFLEDPVFPNPAFSLLVAFSPNHLQHSLGTLHLLHGRVKRLAPFRQVGNTSHQEPRDAFPGNTAWSSRMTVARRGTTFAGGRRAKTRVAARRTRSAGVRCIGGSPGTRLGTSCTGGRRCRRCPMSCFEQWWSVAISPTHKSWSTSRMISGKSCSRPSTSWPTAEP